ncbi:hypothetical protein BH11VER1_BH11VER1_05990 [soil metagenome]
MSTAPFFRSLFVLCAISLSSCAPYAKVFAPASPAPGTRVSWPNVAYTEVRGYCYDYTAEKKSSFFIDGRMHAGVKDAAGVKLSPGQVKRLLTALTVSHDKQKRTACYKPHHAFVFYDAKGKPVAVFEMCFGCNKFVATPGGVPEYIDYIDLANLTQELGLPFGNGNPFYTEACRKK